MISETLEPFFNAGLAVLVWAFVSALWMLAHELLKDNTRLGNEINTPTLREYAIEWVARVALCALTFIVFLWTLSLMGVGE